MKQNQVQQKEIRLGTHGEHYGSWMSNPVFYVIGALLALSVVLAVLSFAVFHNTTIRRLENGQKYISARLSSDKAAILI